ncbi:MAG: sigma-70 family RNA polymerase sigma factor [Acidobacteriota bacterium]
MDGDITELLQHWGGGDPTALERLIPLVNDELRRLAQSHFRREGPGHTLQPTALVNELYMRLSSQLNVRLVSRTQFFAFASRLMRRILVDHHRARQSVKRGEARPRITYDDALGGVAARREVDLLALDGALQELEALDPRMCRIVELRFFGGLTVVETGQALEISPASVKRDWSGAKAFLARALSA